MELKQSTQYGIEKATSVLIVPFMELKHGKKNTTSTAFARLNRTFYGIETLPVLMLIVCASDVLIVPFMELKLILMQLMLLLLLS